MSDFPFSAWGVRRALIGCGRGQEGEGIYLTSLAISRIVSSIGVSLDTLCRSEVLRNRIHYQSAGLPMDIVKVDIVHPEPSKRSLTRLANILPCSANFQN